MVVPYWKDKLFFGYDSVIHVSMQATSNLIYTNRHRQALYACMYLDIVRQCSRRKWGNFFKLHPYSLLLILYGSE